MSTVNRSGAWSVEDKHALKAAVCASRGRFRPWHEALLNARPMALQRSLEFVEAAEDGPISAALRHLIWVAVDAVAGHLYPAGIAIHARSAVAHGATPEQVYEALELAAICSMRSFEIGLPILDRLLFGDWKPPGQDADAIRAMERYEEVMGAAPEWLTLGLRVSPRYTSALVSLVFAPEDATLESKARLLICLAIASSPVVADVVGIERYAAAALRAGATSDELVCVLQLASGIGLHALAVGAPAAVEGLNGSS